MKFYICLIGYITKDILLLQSALELLILIGQWLSAVK